MTLRQNVVELFPRPFSICLFPPRVSRFGIGGLTRQSRPGVKRGKDMVDMENNNVTNNTQQGTQQADQAGERTFTQEDVNRIVQERLARAKTSNEPDERELALQARENALYVSEKIAENGLPKEIAEEFKGMDKVTIDKCIKIIAPFAKKASEPIHNPVGPIGNGSSGNEDTAIRKAMGLIR